MQSFRSNLSFTCHLIGSVIGSMGHCLFILFKRERKAYRDHLIHGFCLKLSSFSRWNAHVLVSGYAKNIASVDPPSISTMAIPVASTAKLPGQCIRVFGSLRLFPIILIMKCGTFKLQRRFKLPHNCQPNQIPEIRIDLRFWWEILTKKS